MQYRRFSYALHQSAIPYHLDWHVCLDILCFDLFRLWCVFFLVGFAIIGGGCGRFGDGGYGMAGIVSVLIL